MTPERVVVAMSGGVDSAVAAARCVAAGFDVIGISLRLARGGEGGCCSLDDFHDAAAVAHQLGIPHYVFDFRDVFDRHVVRPFVADYLAGRTPNPCARCNQHVKFSELRRRARELGAALLATGHYARIVRHPGRGLPMVHAAVDAGKDQSYFLFMLGADELGRTLFPVGTSTKEDVRAEAARLGLPVAAKPESMDVCFVPRGDAGAFVEREAPVTARRPGTIVDTAGAVIGQHDGIHRFTVGQRRGLGLGGGPARYVRRLDARDATVTVTEAKALISTRFVVDEVHWAGAEPPDGTTRLRVRIRHRHPPMACRVAPGDSGTVLVTLEGPGPAVSPGQAAVFYDGDYVLGGGWIVGDAP